MERALLDFVSVFKGEGERAEVKTRTAIHVM